MLAIVCMALHASEVFVVVHVAGVVYIAATCGVYSHSRFCARFSHSAISTFAPLCTAGLTTMWCYQGVTVHVRGHVSGALPTTSLCLHTIPYSGSIVLEIFTWRFFMEIV